MTTTTPPRRDFQALEARRFQAVELFRQGHPQAEITRRLKVSRQTASRWHAAWLKKGSKALKAAGRAGRKPRLEETDLRQVEKSLLKGPKAHGFATELWTLPRIATVIHKTTGVHYHPGHVWKVLKSMGWSRQRPMKRAKEQDPQATERWLKHRWPQVKKTPNDVVPG